MPKSGLLLIKWVEDSFFPVSGQYFLKWDFPGLVKHFNLIELHFNLYLLKINRP